MKLKAFSNLPLSCVCNDICNCDLKFPQGEREDLLHKSQLRQTILNTPDLMTRIFTFPPNGVNPTLCTPLYVLFELAHDN